MSITDYILSMKVYDFMKYLIILDTRISVYSLEDYCAKVNLNKYQNTIINNRHHLIIKRNIF